MSLDIDPSFKNDAMIDSVISIVTKEIAFEMILHCMVSIINILIQQTKSLDYFVAGTMKKISEIRKYKVKLRWDKISNPGHASGEKQRT